MGWKVRWRHERNSTRRQHSHARRFSDDFGTGRGFSSRYLRGDFRGGGVYRACCCCWWSSGPTSSSLNFGRPGSAPADSRDGGGDDAGHPRPPHRHFHWLAVFRLRNRRGPACGGTRADAVDRAADAGRRGRLMGAINGGLVAGLGMPSIVVTLATMAIIRGVLTWATQGGPQICRQVSSGSAHRSKWDRPLFSSWPDCICWFSRADCGWLGGRAGGLCRRIRPGSGAPRRHPAPAGGLLRLCHYGLP